MFSRCRPRKLTISRSNPARSSLRPRATVFDPATNSVTIELNEKINSGKNPPKYVLGYMAVLIAFPTAQEYWPFDIEKFPKSSGTSDHWDIVLDPYQDIVKAVSAGKRKDWHQIIITELRLDELSPWGKCLRRTGILNHGYVRKTIE